MPEFFLYFLRAEHINYYEQNKKNKTLAAQQRDWTSFGLYLLQVVSLDCCLFLHSLTSTLGSRQKPQGLSCSWLHLSWAWSREVHRARRNVGTLPPAHVPYALQSASEITNWVWLVWHWTKKGHSWSVPLSGRGTNATQREFLHC